MKGRQVLLPLPCGSKSVPDCIYTYELINTGVMVGSRTRFILSIITASFTLVSVFEVLRWLQCGGKSLKISKGRGDSWLAAPAAATIRHSRKARTGCIFHRTTLTGGHSSRTPRWTQKPHTGICLWLYTVSGCDHYARFLVIFAVLFVSLLCCLILNVKNSLSARFPRTDAVRFWAVTASTKREP